MSIQSAYNNWSQTYDADENATRDLDQTVLQRVFGQARFKSIIEAGCGTGKNTEFLSGIGDVHALDFSSGMIAKAKEKLAHHTNLTFSQADLTQQWPCPDHSADLVTCNLVLEHVKDLVPVFVEAARVLAKGGQFFVSELHPFRQYQGTVANFKRGEETTRIDAHIHHLSDFPKSADATGFKLKSLQEWWHEKDAGKPPRLVTFLFER
ncbi:MAG TPA: class I SAM-dependent methyltransferase [Verrucomicrobiae bacterium]|jgi:malonyl-CoA O-methyltransferase|nr:class I SAM-dependent methyltransferase [Verrucomicrobiae bacterium]